MKVKAPSSTGLSGPGQNNHIHRAGSDDREQIELTNLSSALAALQADSPELAAKLAELYAVVRTGNYHIDSHALTGSIIREASRPAA